MAIASRPWESARNWREALVSPVVPPSEGPSRVLSLRVPQRVLERVDAVAEDTGHDRTATVLHLLRWALDEYDRQRATEKTQKR